MKVNLILWEDILWKNFYPLSLTRPVFDLRAGAFTFRERAVRFFEPFAIAAICREEMRDIVAAEGIDVEGSSLDSSLPTILLCGRTFFDKRAVRYINEAKVPTVFVSEGVPIGIFLPPGDERWRDFFGQLFDKKIYDSTLSSFDPIELSVANLTLIWELVVNNPNFIAEDFRNFFHRRAVHFTAEPRAVFYNADDIFIGSEVKVDAFAFLDARNGPIIVDEGAHIHSGAVVIGPAVIGTRAVVMSYARIREGTTIGIECRVGGEVEASIFMGYSNKYHDGFIGHSYIGEWVNIGALTTNSDLKNNYGEVRVAMPEGIALTGYNKIGTFIGDHSKLGIGTLIPSGSTIGVSVNFYGGGMMSKYTPSFMWGSFYDGFMHYNLEKAIDTARIVMKRRDRELLLAQDQLLRGMHGFFAEDRTHFIHKHNK